MDNEIPFMTSFSALLGMVQVSSNLANPLLIIFSNIPKIKSIKPIAQKLNEFSDYRKQDTDTKKSPTFNEMICRLESSPPNRLGTISIMAIAIITHTVTIMSK